jgi:hypothetical protein
MVSFPHLSQPQLCLSCHPYMAHFPPTSFFFVVRGTDNEVPTISTEAQISPSVTYSQTVSDNNPPTMWENKFHIHTKQNAELE